MIINYFIPPHPTLELIIDNYIVSTSDNKRVTFKSFWPASNEVSLIFHLADQPEHVTNDINRSRSLQNKDSCIIGLLPQFNGIISFSGIYHRFVIQFKPNGFYEIFRIPFSEFTNKIFRLDEVFGRSAIALRQQLINEKDVQKMACYADKFLLTFLNRQKVHNNICDRITATSNELCHNTPLSNIGQYAYKANMSIRNFERRFIEQVGISPKLYCRLARFNNALITKLKNPQKNWTSIAHACGYYDQMHMIKEFKQFAKLNPSHLLQLNTDFIRPRIDVTGSGIETFLQLNVNLTYEKFLPVKRKNF